MSLLDGPFWLLARADGLVSGLPEWLRVTLWALVGAALSMELYRLLSPQAHIRTVKATLAEAQAKVAAFDGPFEEGWPLIRRMLALALRRVWLVLPATLAASVPLLVLILWLAVAYGAVFPPAGSSVSVRATPAYEARWVESGLGNPRPLVEVAGPAGETVVRAPVAAPVETIGKWRWWNALVGNPAGYLPDNGPVEEVRIDLPRRQFLSAGPDWLRGWEVVFLPALLLAALGYKRLRRVA